MKVGLFFGSFNPIHKGHIAIARYMAGKTDLDQVWLVVSPHNPLKDKRSLADAKERLASARKAVGRNSRIKVSKVEFSLPEPSYTVRTLAFMKRKYTRNKFVLIIGSDNLSVFHKWKDYKKILRDHRIYVYPRSGSKGGKLKNHHSVKLVTAPRIDISSTQIRSQLKKGSEVKNLLA